MTNWEKYFGTPEKVSKMTIEDIDDDRELLDGVDVWFDGEEHIGVFWRQTGVSFLEWLKQEAS